jgi:hypothetical protein
MLIEKFAATCCRMSGGSGCFLLVPELMERIV